MLRFYLHNITCTCTCSKLLVTCSIYTCTRSKLLVTCSIYTCTRSKLLVTCSIYTCTCSKPLNYPHTHTHTQYPTPKKRHLSAPHSTFGPAGGPGSNGVVPDTDLVWVPPASLSFHQTKEQQLLKKMVAELDTYQLPFKLGPAYGLYLVAKHHLCLEFQPGCSGSERRKRVVTALRNMASHLKRTIKVHVRGV